MKTWYFSRIILFTFLFQVSQFAFAQTLSIPYSTDFESGYSGWSFSSINPNTTWQWGLPTTSPTNSCHSGVNCMDVNLNSVYQPNADCELISPYFNIGGIGGVEIAFWHNYFTENGWDGIRIEYTIDSGLTWIQLGTFQDANGINWYTYSALNSTGKPGWSSNSFGWIESKIKLYSLNTPKIRFKFIFNSDPAVQEVGYSIDDFSIKSLPLIDASIVNIVTPSLTSTSGQVSPVSFTLKNAGLQVMSSVLCNFQLNSGSIISENFNFTPLSSNDSIILSFTTPLTIPVGSYSLKVFTNDINTINDTATSILFGNAVINVPYFDNFDNGNLGWTTVTLGNPQSNWELGSANFGFTNTNYSGSSCWDINLNSAYTNDAEAYLISPVFDFNPSNLPQISFYYNLFTELTWDGFRVDYLDSTGIWKVLGNANDPNGQNWYNDSSLRSSFLPAFSGSSLGWKKAYYNIASIAHFSSLQFRFVFTSDGSVFKDGVSIDDISIYVPIAKDAEAISILPEMNSFKENSNIDIKLHFKSNGYTSFSNITLKYTINNGTTNSIVSNNLLNFNDTISVTLTSLNLPSGTYTIKSWLELPGDLNLSNDTVTKIYYGIPVITPQYYNDFEISSIDFQNNSSSSINSKWELGLPNYGVCNSTHSGNNCWDVNLNSSTLPFDTCYLYTPFFNLNNTTLPKLSFWQNRSIGFAKFKVEYEINSNGLWTTLGVLNDANGINWYNSNSSVDDYWDFSSNGWIKCSYNLSNFISNSVIRFRFSFTDDGGNTDGVSIDDFEVTQLFANDISPISIVSPGTEATAGINNNLKIVIKNNGSSTLTNTSIKYKLNNGPIIPYTWTGNLAYNATDTVSLTSFNPNTGTNTLKIYTDFTNDANRFNDTISFTFIGILSAPLPYFENFDITINTWNPAIAGLTSTNWELGTPNYSTTNSTYSGSNCWDINLSSSYGNLALNYLYSPIFTLQNVVSSQLNFWLNYNTEIGCDGLRLEYSTNGTSWQVLGTLNDANASNWYSNLILSQNKPGWTGNSGGWINATYQTNFLNGSAYLRFRFVFTSDFSFSGAGVSVDDFSLSQTVSLNEIGNKLDWHVFPNPTSDILNLVSGIKISNSQISIHDVLGKEVFNSNNLNLNAGELFSINTSEFAAGIYSISIMQKEKIQVVKFIKN